MAHPVLALGAAAVIVSGYVWYVPAIIELRAGDDRPVSTRLAASACLAGWGTGAVLTLLLLTTAPWPALCAAALAGTAVAILLRVKAYLRRKAEQAEESRRWAALGCGGTSAEGKPPTLGGPFRSGS